MLPRKAHRSWPEDCPNPGSKGRQNLGSKSHRNQALKGDGDPEEVGPNSEPKDTRAQAREAFAFRLKRKCELWPNRFPNSCQGGTNSPDEPPGERTVEFPGFGHEDVRSLDGRS